MREEIFETNFMWGIVESQLPKDTKLLKLYNIGLFNYDAIIGKEIDTITITVSVS